MQIPEWRTENFDRKSQSTITNVEKIGVNLGEAKMDNKWKETLICDLLNFLFRIYMVQYAIFRNFHQHLRNLHNFDYNILGSCRLKSFVPSFFRVFAVLLNCFTYCSETSWLILNIKNENFGLNLNLTFLPQPPLGGGY